MGGGPAATADNSSTLTTSCATRSSTCAPSLLPLDPLSCSCIGWMAASNKSLPSSHAHTILERRRRGLRCASSASGLADERHVVGGAGGTPVPSGGGRPPSPPSSDSARRDRGHPSPRHLSVPPRSPNTGTSTSR